MRGAIGTDSTTAAVPLLSETFYRRRHESRRSQKPKVHYRNKKYVVWNTDICPIVEIPDKNCVVMQNFTEIRQWATQLWLAKKKRFLTWRPYAIFKNVYISCDCHLVP